MKTNNNKKRKKEKNTPSTLTQLNYQNTRKSRNTAETTVFPQCLKNNHSFAVTSKKPIIPKLSTVKGTSKLSNYFPIAASRGNQLLVIGKWNKPRLQLGDAQIQIVLKQQNYKNLISNRVEHTLSWKLDCLY